MKIKQLQDTNFQDYYKASMLLATCYCDGKCWRERNLAESDCQNESLLAEPNMDVDDDEIIQRYLANPMTKAIIIGGLEPMLQFFEVYHFIDKLRNEYHCNDDVVIYTGYTREECGDKVVLLGDFCNIVIKWGRFSPKPTSHYDPILGINLASSNQYGERL